MKCGWGIFCSKNCKAKEQERRTGQYSQYLDDCTTDFVKYLDDDESVVQNSVEYVSEEHGRFGVSCDKLHESFADYFVRLR